MSRLYSLISWRGGRKNGEQQTLNSLNSSFFPQSADHRKMGMKCSAMEQTLLLFSTLALAPSLVLSLVTKRGSKSTCDRLKPYEPRLASCYGARVEARIEARSKNWSKKHELLRIFLPFLFLADLNPSWSIQIGQSKIVSSIIKTETL